MNVTFFVTIGAPEGVFGALGGVTECTTECVTMCNLQGEKWSQSDLEVDLIGCLLWVVVMEMVELTYGWLNQSSDEYKKF